MCQNNYWNWNPGTLPWEIKKLVKSLNELVRSPYYLFRKDGFDNKLHLASGLGFHKQSQALISFSQQIT